MTENLMVKADTANLFGDTSTASLPTYARVVIIGGGIAGVSVAYHLARLGWTDVVVLERGRLTGGTTWHAAGLVRQTSGSAVLTQLSTYGATLYETIEAETGLPTGFKRVGALTVARTQERMEELKRTATMSRSCGLDVAVLNPANLPQIHPLIRTDDLVGSVYFPTDGVTNPGDSALSIAKGAADRGVRFFERARVIAVQCDGRGVTGVSADRGDIRCEVVVNCAGLWAHEIGRLGGVNVPLHAAEHMYLVTGPVAGAAPTLPILRDLDGRIYARQYQGRLVVGAFEPESKPRPVESIPPDFEFGEFDPDWAHAEIPLRQMRHRLPVLENVGLAKFLNGPESFTPDNNFLLGEAPELKNFFIAAGFNSQGVIFGPGAGRALAEWIVEGQPTMDLAEVDVARFGRFTGNRAYLFERTRESLGRLYGMHWPHLQPTTARNVRRTPLYDRLAAKGACFGEAAGWERANWFASPGVKPEYAYSYGRQNWFEHVRQEHHAVREAVGLYDMSTFAKFIVEGIEAEPALQWLCAANVAVAVGKVVYTPLLNRRGGIEMDLTVTRLAQDRFLIIAPTLAQNRTFHWLRRNLPPGSRAVITDVTSGYGAVAVMGPKSRELLSRLTSADLSNEVFPFSTAQEIEVAYAPALALRVTYVGELGWEIYAPTEFMVGVYDALTAASADEGLRLYGFHALDSLRSEKGYRHWGHDIGCLDTPFEAGLAFTLAFDKGSDFLGREALLARQDQPVTRRLAHFLLEDETPLLLHDEPIYRDGQMVGRITSGAFGYTLGRSVGLGYLQCEAGVTAGFVASGHYEIEIAGQRFAAKASLRPFYDPAGERVRR